MQALWLEDGELSMREIDAPDREGEALVRVLLSGICGTDGYLQTNQKLEWMLAPGSVGTFIQVGDDDPGLLHHLAGSRVRPEKRDPSYAIGLTSTKRMWISRVNIDTRDDVQLEKGHHCLFTQTAGSID